MLDFFNSLPQAWRLTILSSCLCILGNCIIFLEEVYEFIFPRFITLRYKFTVKENYEFMNGSLSFSAGCLLFTSLYRLLPEALSYLQKSNALEGETTTDSRINLYLICSYVAGAAICLLFNAILHMLTSESVVHCNHGGHDHEQNDDNEDSHSHEHSHNNDLHQHMVEVHSNIGNKHSHQREVENHHTHHDHTAQAIDEQTPLMHVKLSTRKSFIHYIAPHSIEEEVGECKGYTSAEYCLYKAQESNTHRLHFCDMPSIKSYTSELHDDGHMVLSHYHLNENQDYVPEQSNNKINHEDHIEDHHHHVNSPLSRLLLIGVQTSMAITMHKLPEGFITYITSATDRELGFSIFLSLLVHNFTEGFSMCLPLYYLFSIGSNRFAKLKAWCISAFLGGISQPIGAFIGYLFLQHTGSQEGGDIDLKRIDFIFGITIAVTSGFLSVIGLSMYGSSISFGGSMNFTMLWCIVGMSVIGLSSIISAH